MGDIVKQEGSAPSIPQYNLLDKRFHSALQVVDDIVLKNYVQRLREFSIIPLDEKVKASNLSENVRLFKITEMVYEKDEFAKIGRAHV